MSWTPQQIFYLCLSGACFRVSKPFQIPATPLCQAIPSFPSPGSQYRNSSPPGTASERFLSRPLWQDCSHSGVRGVHLHKGIRILGSRWGEWGDCRGGVAGIWNDRRVLETRKQTPDKHKYNRLFMTFRHNGVCFPVLHLVNRAQDLEKCHPLNVRMSESLRSHYDSRGVQDQCRFFVLYQTLGCSGGLMNTIFLKSLYPRKQWETAALFFTTGHWVYD